VISDVFSFCGTITSLSVLESSGEETVTAIVTFESEAAAKTAVLLNNALIHDRTISVALAPSGFQPPASSVSADNLPQGTDPAGRTEASVMQDLLDAGYKLSNDALSQAKAWDEKVGISQTLSVGLTGITTTVNQLDESLQLSNTAKSLGDTISTKAAAVNQEYQISTKAGEVGGQALDFFQQTASTIATGANSAADSVTNFVNTNPQVSQGVQTVQAVGNAIGQSITEAFGAIVTAISPGTQANPGTSN